MNKRTSALGLFALVSLIWGLTWIPIKIGVAAIPPMLFGALRGLAAGAILLVIAGRGSGSIRIARNRIGRLLFVALLSYAATYGLLFWGAARIDSGLAAVVNLSLVPTSLLLVGAMMGEERLGIRKFAATAIGIAGLFVLYRADLQQAGGQVFSAGVVSVALSALAYAVGVVFSRVLLRHYRALLVAGWTQLSGGAMLGAVSLIVEAESPSAIARLAQPPVLLSWLFLVTIGSAVAFTGYLRLTHLWSPHRAGLYAFVSPVIAVLVGILVLHENVSSMEGVGMALMFAGAALAFWKPDR